ncbi:MAG: DUF1343 domain-containing protein [Atribacterota bacterium]|nr:DUF1343 domain-containing protein [Atribacterota bacterium]
MGINLNKKNNYFLMKKTIFKTLLIMLFLVFTYQTFPIQSQSQVSIVKLGNEVLLDNYIHLIDGKNVGLITNQTGVDSKGVSLIENLLVNKHAKLIALYAPEHGLDGTAKAGEWVNSYIHPEYDIPVYSLYGSTRMPTQEMLLKVEVLLFDIQDIGARSYTYMSTLNYCMIAAEKYNKKIIVLDRPNPLGGLIVEGPVMENEYKSFVGVDNLPMAHGMTVGELALFYNRNIGADLVVITMEGYHRGMSYLDTGLPFVQTSPNIPDLTSLYGYMATGLGEGTGVFQRDKFQWIGGKGLDSIQFASLLNNAGLKGVSYIPEDKDTAGGVRLEIYDPTSFNPARSGIYALSYAFMLGDFNVPKSTADNIVMFDKIMGNSKIGRYLEKKASPLEIESSYYDELQEFKEKRKEYLISLYDPPIHPIHTD